MNIIKLTKEQSDLYRISNSPKELNGIGEQQGWSDKTPSEDLLSELGPAVAPAFERLDVEVEKYSERTWAVKVNGELLCVTAYRKGAYSVRNLLQRLWQQITVWEATV